MAVLINFIPNTLSGSYFISDTSYFIYLFAYLFIRIATAPTSYNDELIAIHKNNAPDQTATNSIEACLGLNQCLGKNQIFTAFQKVKMIGALKAQM